MLSSHSEQIANMFESTDIPGIFWIKVTKENIVDLAKQFRASSIGLFTDEDANRPITPYFIPKETFSFHGRSYARIDDYIVSIFYGVIGAEYLILDNDDFAKFSKKEDESVSSDES